MPETASKSSAPSLRPDPAAPVLRLRLHSHFEPLMVMCHHPIRLTTSLLIPLFLLPEFTSLAETTLGLEGQMASFFVVMMIVFIVFLPQLMVSALNCRKIHFDFYDDHMAFTESFLLREPIRIPYRSVVALHVKQNVFQRMFKLADIVIETSPAARFDTHNVMTVLPDLRYADRAQQRIDRLLKRYQQQTAEAHVLSSEEPST
jgi:uncharacterized membrane protein YdbT with pleckstrin-like domain